MGERFIRYCVDLMLFPCDATVQQRVVKMDYQNKKEYLKHYNYR